MTRTHGKAATYRNGCRCEPCLTAAREEDARRRYGGRQLKQDATLDPRMTPEHLVRVLAELICPLCGAGPFVALGGHFRWHKVTADDMKESAGLNRKAALCSEDLSERMSELGNGRLNMERIRTLGAASSSGGRQFRNQGLANLRNARNLGPAPTFEVGVAVGHGSKRSYDAGCRCLKCRSANNKYHALKRADRASRREGADLAHGLESTYTNWGCRCAECAAAWSLACKNRKRYKQSWRA